MKRRGRSEGVTVHGTDKSGNLAVDEKGNYKEKMKEHVEKDKVIDRAEHDRRERVMVGHGKQWARVLRVGENGGKYNEKKCRESFIKTSSKIF